MITTNTKSLATRLAERRSVANKPSTAFVNRALCAALAFTFPLTALARQDTGESLLFSTDSTKLETTLSGSSGTSQRKIGREDIAVVTPGPPGASAEAFLTHQNLGCLLGDRNLDGTLYQAVLTAGIDALHVCPSDDPRNHNLYISVAKDLAPTAALPLIRDGDIFSPRADGTVEFLMREYQIRMAFGIATTSFNVDAFAVDKNGTISMSFSDTVTFSSGVVVEDGAIVSIPFPSITMDDCRVTEVVPASGIVLVTQDTINAMIVNSGVRNNKGKVPWIYDLTGLDPDDDEETGGVFLHQVPGLGTLPFYHLRFSGVGLNGGAVLTTVGGGQIAQMNGVLLGSTGKTNGHQVGLVPTGKVTALAGIASPGVSDPTRFTLDTNDHTLVPGSVFEMSCTGAAAAAPILLYPAVSTPAGLLGAAPDTSFIANPGHTLVLSTLLSPMGPFASDGAGNLRVSIPIPLVTPPGLEVMFQAFTPLGPGGAPGFSGSIAVRY